MLKQLSKFERTSKVLILGFVALMAVSLVLFFRPGGGGAALEPTNINQVLATVGGEDITVGESASQSQFKQENPTFDLTDAVVSPAKLAEKITPTDDESKAYYDKPKTDYSILVPQKRIRYVFVDQNKSGEKVQISDKELQDEYNNLEPQYKQAGVKAQQIVLKVAREDLDATVKTKADGLVAKARANGETISEQEFADLAKGNSEDPATAKGGGWLSGIVKKNPNKPDDPYQSVLDMQLGEVTDAIKYKNAYFILRRGDSVPKTFEGAKPELIVSLRNRRGYTIAQKIAQKAQDRLKETKDPQKVAQELAAEANMSAADMIRETPFVKPGDDVPKIGSSQQFEEAIAPLNNPNDVGERVGIKDGFAVPILVEQKPPRIPEFDEVKDKVTQAVKDEKAKSMLEQKAKELAAGVKTPGDLKAAAERMGLEAKAEANYKISTPLGEAGSSVLIDDPLYAAKGGDVLQPIFLNSNYLIIGVNKRTEADMTEYAKQRDSLTQSALSDRKNQIFADYLNALSVRMKQDGSIKIYKEVFDGVREEEPEAMPARRPQLPVKQ